MRATVDRKEFLTALRKAGLVSPKTGKDPIINHVKLEVTEGKLTVSATDYEQTLIQSITAESTIAGDCLVVTDKIRSIIYKAQGDTVQIECTPQMWIYLEFGSFKIKIPGMNAEAFPICEVKPKKKMFTMEPGDLKDVYDKVHSAIGENESRKNLMGVNIKNDGCSHVRWMGADSFRIAELVKETETSGDFDLIFHKKHMANAEQIFKKCSIELYDAGDFLQIISENISYQSRLIEAEYPQLSRLLQKGEKEVTTELSDLNYSLGMLGIVTENERNAVLKMTVWETLKLESQKLEFGEGQTEIDCEAKGEITCGLNINFFGQMMKAFGSKGKVTIWFNNHEEQILLESPDIEGFKAVIMPVRIKW